MKLCQKIKSLDQYGYELNLNFNGEDSYFKTKIGGILSLGMSVFILYLTIIRFQYMVNRSQDQINIIEIDSGLN